MNVGKGQTVPPGVTIEGLWERVETLIRERDEARSELAASREAWAVELDGAQTRRDELQRAYEAEAAQLRAALESKVRLTRERDTLRVLLEEYVAPGTVVWMWQKHADWKFRVKAALEGRDG